MAFAARAGFATIHGPNAASSWGELSWNSFRRLAFDGKTTVYRNPDAADDRLVQQRWRTRTFRPGQAVGRLPGGNLTVLAADLKSDVSGMGWSVCVGRGVAR